MACVLRGMVSIGYGWRLVHFRACLAAKLDNPSGIKNH